eukprot:5292320-Pyramimonas_sp.AAC.2
MSGREARRVRPVWTIYSRPYEVWGQGQRGRLHISACIQGPPCSITASPMPLLSRRQPCRAA